MRTTHVWRVNEFGPSTGETAPAIDVDLAAADFIDLAAKLDA